MENRAPPAVMGVDCLDLDKRHRFIQKQISAVKWDLSKGGEEILRRPATSLSSPTRRRQTACRQMAVGAVRHITAADLQAMFLSPHGVISISEPRRRSIP